MSRPIGAFYEDVEGARQLFKRHGLTARERSFRARPAREDARQGSAKSPAGSAWTSSSCPISGPTTARPTRVGWAAFGQRLAKAGAPVRAEGLRFAWHNHDFEFKALPDGSYPDRARPVDGVLWEADIAWIVARQGRSAPLAEALCRQGAARSRQGHRQGRARRRDEDGWADVGAGILPWQEFWDLGVAAGAEAMIAEHDNPSDLERFAASERRCDAPARQRTANKGS